MALSLEEARGKRRADIQWKIQGLMVLLAGGGMMLAASRGMQAVPAPEGGWRLTQLSLLMNRHHGTQLSKVSSLPKIGAAVQLSTHPSSCPRALTLVQLSKAVG